MTDLAHSPSAHTHREAGPAVVGDRLPELIATRNLKEHAFGPPIVLRGDRVTLLSTRMGPHCALYHVRTRNGMEGEWADHAFRPA